MAQSGYTPLLSYGSTTATNVPLAANLTTNASGVELAVNAADGKLFYKDTGGVVQVLASKAGNVNVASFSAGTTGFTPSTATTGVVTLAGTLNVANGGTGVTTSTGSGNNVLSTSPTLVTPILGTPTSVTLTNATGLPLGTGVTGTLATTNGGTGLTSFTSGGVVYASSTSALTTGSALTFDGTNLTVGGSATEKLSTNGSLRVSGAVSANATGGILAYQGSGTTMLGAWGANTSTVGQIQFYLSSSDGSINGELMRLTSTGLGIGTSSPAYKLQLNSGSAIDIETAVTNSAGLSRFGTRGSGNSFAGSFTAGKSFELWSAGSLNATLDSSGNLGLGVTPSAWGSGSSALQNTAGSIWRFGTDNIYFGQNYYFNGTNRIYSTTNNATEYQQGNGQHRWFTAPSGTAGNAITFTQAMTLDASGNLLIGRTTVPVQNTAGAAIQNTGLIITESSQTQGGLWVNRITSDGNVLYFTRQNSAVGSISVTGSATAYNTSSDYRLKEITGPITTSGSYIDSLNPVEGTWKADGSTFVGLIAHEVQEASRTPVATGVKDGEEMQSIDYSNAEIIANLIAEIQSLRKRLAALESK